VNFDHATKDILGSVLCIIRKEGSAANLHWENFWYIHIKYFTISPATETNTVHVIPNKALCRSSVTNCSGPGRSICKTLRSRFISSSEADDSRKRSLSTHIVSTGKP
jgi:hypothetical protein